jgi:hypothetical protein
MIVWIILLLAQLAQLATGLETNNVTQILSNKTSATPSDDPFIKNYIVNRHDFSYIHNPGFQVCGGDKPTNKQKVFVIVYVHSAPENLKRRLSLRETWQRRSMFKHVRFVFMMGYAKHLQNKLKLEADIYKDIVQEDFIDAYRNITYKGIMAMKWISQYCSHAKYILKVDDDIVSNFFILLRHLKSLTKHESGVKKKVYCLGKLFS